MRELRDRRTGAYRKDIGRSFRVGYYGACRDRLAVVWLVDEHGENGATTDHDDLRRYFRVVRRSDETDSAGRFARFRAGASARPDHGAAQAGVEAAREASIPGNVR